MDRFNVESSKQSYEDGRSHKGQENQKKIDNRHLWLHPNQEMDNGPQGPSNREIDGQKAITKAQSMGQSNKRYEILDQYLDMKIRKWESEYNLEDYIRFRESKRQQK